MSAQSDIPLPYNPAIFRWARERLAISAADAAHKVNVPESRIQDWETGQAAPTTRQGRILADLYGRHFLEFFADAAPETQQVQLVPDFRPFSGHKQSDQERIALEAVQEWSEEMRSNALTLIELVGERAPLLSSNLKFSVSDDVEVASSVIREAMSFPVSEQIGLRTSSAHTLPTILRRKLELMGVIVLKDSGITKHGVRGICLFAEILPVIVFGNESASAQAFTLMHEFAHVLLRQSGISGPPISGSGATSSSATIEAWCNRFSAAFLIPVEALTGFIRRPTEPASEFDLGVLSQLAKSFSVSRHAMLIRLVDLGYVKSSFYWQRMRPVFSKEEEEYQAFGRSPYYGKRFVNSHGEFYTGLVLDAWGQGQITAHNAAEFMGIKNISHLLEIREDFQA